MTDCLIGLGANLNHPARQLVSAVEQIASLSDVESRAVSDWHISPAVGGPSGQGDYLNGVMRIRTSRSPIDVLHALQRVEQTAGRKRSDTRWIARTLDLDLLLQGQTQLDTAELTLPHPRMLVRQFVLQPAAQVAPDFVHPDCGWPIGRLASHLRYAVPLVALVGPSWPRRDMLLRQIADRMHVRRIDLELPSADSTGPHSRGSLEWRRLAEEQLFAQCWTQLPDPVICSFWPDEFAETREGSSQLRPFPQPKVLMHVAADSPRAGTDSTDHPCQPVSFEQIRNRFDGPIFRIQATSSELAVEECVAALQAMQPL